MSVNKFLESQTFKTGVFVLFVLFVLLIVFKLGVIHGHTKTNFSHGYNNGHYRSDGGAMLNHQFNYQGHQKGMYDKTTHENIILKKQFFIDKAMSGSEKEIETVIVDTVE